MSCAGCLPPSGTRSSTWCAPMSVSYTHLDVYKRQVMGITPEQLAMIAARAMIPKAPPTVALEHLHAAQISVRDQAAILVTRLRVERTCSFRTLVADADSTLVIVARFLALLELYKEGAITFDQAEPLADLAVRWTGSDEGDIAVDAEFDEDDAQLDFDDAGTDTCLLYTSRWV